MYSILLISIYLYSLPQLDNNGVLRIDDDSVALGPILGMTIPLIAPYYADVDTRPRSTGNGSNSVWYRTTTDPALLKMAMGLAGFSPTFLLIITWDEVGYYDQHTDKVSALIAHESV